MDFISGSSQSLRNHDFTWVMIIDCMTKSPIRDGFVHPHVNYEFSFKTILSIRLSILSS